MGETRKKLLVFNCHESWVYQLCFLDFDLDIIVGLAGKYKQSWDENIRPVPPRARLITLPMAIASSEEYYCIIVHNTRDLLDIKSRHEPKIMVIHSTIEGRAMEEGSRIEACQMREMFGKFRAAFVFHPIAVSQLKGRSWGGVEDIVVFGEDLSEYFDYKGSIASGLRICNFISSRQKILLWDFYAKAFGGIPVKLIGHNPDIPGVRPSKSWEDLKHMLSRYRFYVHTARAELEDGYNMSTLEAMAAGMPVLGNEHPSSVVEHGVSGFLSDDPVKLNEYAMLLLNDKQLAVQMGIEARKTVARLFSKESFVANFGRSIERARQKQTGVHI